MKHITLLVVACMLLLQLFSQEDEKAYLADRLEQHVIFLASDSLEGRGLGTAGKELAKNYIGEQFRNIGLKTYQDQDFFHYIEFRLGLAWVPGVNVVGWLKGSDPDLQEEFIVVGAHYDHLGYKMAMEEKVIFHGADDNASGVAAVIELARYFASNPELVKRSIIFIAFDGEESGLLGAKKFVNENTLTDVSTIRVMFSIDMIGMYTDNKGLNLKGISTLSEGESIAKSIAETMGIQLKNTSAEIESGTDTWPFGEKGIPAVHAFTGLKSPYHKTGDTYEKLDYEGMAGAFMFVRSLITGILAASELGPSKQFIRMQKPCALHFNAGVTAGLGSSRYRYAEEFYNAKSIFAYNAGLFLQMHIGKRITLQPEILYQADGSKSAEGNFRRQSICVPLNLHFNIVNESGGMFKFYPFAGGYFMHTFGGKNGGKEIDFDKEYNSQEWGFNLGMGMDVKKFQAKLYWQRGLSELSQNKAKDINTSAWFFSIGYIF